MYTFKTKAMNVLHISTTVNLWLNQPISLKASSNYLGFHKQTDLKQKSMA